MSSFPPQDGSLFTHCGQCSFPDKVSTYSVSASLFPSALVELAPPQLRQCKLSQLGSRLKSSYAVSLYWGARIARVSLVNESLNELHASPPHGAKAMACLSSARLRVVSEEHVLACWNISTSRLSTLEICEDHILLPPSYLPRLLPYQTLTCLPNLDSDSYALAQ